MSEAIQGASEQLKTNIKLELSRFLQGSAEDLAQYGEDITRDLEVAIARQDEKLLAELRAQIRALGAKRKIQASNAAWSLLDHLLAAAFHAAIAKLDELALIASSGETPDSNPASGRAMARVLLSVVAVILISFAAWGCSSPGCVPAADTKPLLDIALDRHDAYVEADLTLDPTEKAAALRSSAILRDLFETAAASGQR